MRIEGRNGYRGREEEERKGMIKERPGGIRIEEGNDNRENGISKKVGNENRGRE